VRDDYPTNIVNQVVPLPTPIDVGGSDAIGWEGTNTHEFTIRSASRLHIHALEGVRNLCGTGKDLIVSKLSSSLWSKTASLSVFIEASGEWAYLCTRCGRYNETTIHVVWDCVYTT
jgi:hypothetical protein